MSFSHIILYDGTCALCNQIVSFVLPRDKNGKFGFASLQSKFAHELLAKHGQDADELNTFYCIRDYGQPEEAAISRAAGGLFVLSQLGGIYAMTAVLRILPMSVLNMLYGVIARNRYRWFGKYETCRMPEPQWQTRFIDAVEETAGDAATI